MSNRLALWIPLRAVDRHHGTMEVAPGSHRLGPFPYCSESTAQPEIARSEITRRGLRTHTLELPAGDGVIFNPWLVHASVPNIPQTTKWVLLLHIQELATFINPDDPADPLRQFLELSAARRGPAAAPARRVKQR